MNYKLSLDTRAASNAYGLGLFGLLCAIFFGLSSPTLKASQLGPILPTHHFPTDRSFHLAYRFHFINSSSNFLERLVTDPLTNNARLRIIRHELIPEFQPNRKLSFGARVVLDSLSMTADSGSWAGRTTLGDQAFFVEFRVLDEPGSSLGFAGVVKIPSYSNPTLLELTESSAPNNTLLPGDAQTDTTLLLTTEYWAGANLRLRADAGLTKRLDGYASELPYNLSIGVVNPKMDFELRLRGNFSLGKGESNDTDTETIREAFSNSDYAYSPSPWVMVIEPNVELWLSAKTAVSLQYSYSVMGKNSPSYHAMSAGLIYRWAETHNSPRKTFKEVPIYTDQESGRFEGDSTTPQSESLYLDEDPVFEK